MKIDQLLDNVKTEDDRRNLYELLDSVKSLIFKTGESRTQFIGTNKTFGPILLSILGTDFDKLDPIQANQQLNLIIDSIKSLHSTQVYVVNHPTANSFAALVDFVQTQTNKKSVLDIKIKPEILGGAIFVIDGKYIDMSVSNRLAKAFEGNHLQELLKNQDS